MDRKLPDREQLLADVFDIVRQHQPLMECTLQEKLEESRAGISNSEVSIALCMLQARGMVNYFTVQAADSVHKPCRKRPFEVDVMYKVAEPVLAEDQADQDDKKPNIFQRIFG